MIPALPCVTAPALEVSTAADAKVARTKSPHLTYTLVSSPLCLTRKHSPIQHSATRLKSGKSLTPPNGGSVGGRTDGREDPRLRHDLPGRGEHVLEPVCLVVPQCDRAHDRPRDRTPDERSPAGGRRARGGVVGPALALPGRRPRGLRDRGHPDPGAARAGRSRRTRRSRTRSNSPASGRGRPSSGPRSAAPTRLRSHWRMQARRRRCGGRSRSCSGSRLVRRRRSSRAACASAGFGACPGGRALRRSRIRLA